MATKIDYFNALRNFGISEEEMSTWTIAQMAEKLRELRKNQEKENTPDKPKNLKTIEIARSYSRKVNLGNYQTEDYFSSRKAEVGEDDDLRQVSNFLAYECKIDVEMQIEGSLNKKDNLPF